MEQGSRREGENAVRSVSSGSEISRVLRKLADKAANNPNSTRITAKSQITSVTASLAHPHILSPSMADRWNGVTFEEVLENTKQGDVETLRAFSLGTLLTIFQSVCDAIGFAHSQGHVHGNLTTGCIWLGAHGEAYVAGFEEGERKEGNPPIEGDIAALAALLYEILTLESPRRIAEGRVLHPNAFNAANRKRRKHVLIEEAKEIACAHYACNDVSKPLAAICMRALNAEETGRYRSVDELQRDVSDFRKRACLTEGPTGLEERPRRLAPSRTKLAVVGGTVALLMVAGILVALRHDRVLSPAQGWAVANLRAEARSLASERKLEEALGKLSGALQLAPGDADSHALKGDILQSSLRLKESQDAYRLALRYNPNHPSAAENAQLCERIIQATGKSGEPSLSSLIQLQTAMKRQRRTTDTAALQRRLEGHKQELLVTWRDRLKRSALGPKLEAARRNPSLDENGILSLNLKGLPIEDVTALKEMPLTNLDLSETKVSDLTALEGMPLTVLQVLKTSVDDLSPLRGMPLDRLDASSTSVRDLEPLRGMPLTWLSVSDTSVDDLRPLEDMPLKVLRVVRTGVKDISALKDMPLEQFAVAYTSVADLSPLKGKKITELMMQRTAVEDLSPLEGMPLRSFHLQYTPVKDISSLRGMPLSDVVFEGCAKIGDINALIECKGLERLCLPPNCRDVEFLREFPKLTHLGYVYRPILNPTQRWPQTTADFWKEYDAKKRREDGR